MGVGTVCDSLAAIEQVVFNDRKATLADVREAMLHNFEGYEELRDILLDAPKYGNGDWFADKYAVWFVDFLSEVFLRIAHMMAADCTLRWRQMSATYMQVRQLPLRRTGAKQVSRFRMQLRPLTGEIRMELL